MKPPKKMTLGAAVKMSNSKPKPTPTLANTQGAKITKQVSVTAPKKESPATREKRLEMEMMKSKSTTSGRVTEKIGNKPAKVLAGRVVKKRG